MVVVNPERIGSSSWGTLAVLGFLLVPSPLRAEGKADLQVRLLVEGKDVTTSHGNDIVFTLPLPVPGNRPGKQ